jgi:hypothetical protein
MSWLSSVPLRPDYPFSYTENAILETRFVGSLFKGFGFSTTAPQREDNLPQLGEYLSSVAMYLQFSPG